MKLFNTAQIREWDRITIQKYFEDSSELMETVAQVCADHISEEEIAASYEILCGIGNNGGDGLCIARLLAGADHQVKVFIVGESDAGSEDFKKNLQQLLNTDVAIQFLTESGHEYMPDKDAMIIDCLFGTGLNRPVEGWLAAFIHQVNQFENRKIAIDLPSGLQSDLIEVQDGAIIKADITFTLQIPKRALLFEENYPFVGELEVLMIGLDHEYEAEETSELTYFTELDAARIFKSRKKFQHKNSFGHVGVIAGSKGKMGAAMLCSLAAMRAGAGLVTAQVPAIGESYLQTVVPEAMCIADEGEHVLRSAEIMEAHAATAIGPGIGQAPETVMMMRRILKQSGDHRLVLDADALNIIAHKKLQHAIPANSILTPHVGEFDRLFGLHKNSFERFHTLRERAIALQCVIVLKGAHTMIATPDGEVSFNSSGNPGMATAGSGDVLSGVLVSLCAQGYHSKDAARLGVYIHGVSGDMVAEQRGMTGMMARDIIEFLPAALDEVETTKEILGWK